MEQLRALDKELSSPGVDKLYIAARRKGMEVTKEQVRDFAATRHTNETLRLHKPYVGKSAAEGPNVRWQLDLAAMPLRRGYMGFILTVDVFTRQAYAQLLRNRTGPTTTAAFAELLRKAGKKPDILTCDQGNLPRLCEERGITLRNKDRDDRNAIAVVDRAMSTIKLDLKKRVMNRQGQWPDLLQAVVRGYNGRYHEAVHGAPKEVETNDTQHFMVKQDNADKMAFNHQLNEKRELAVVSAGHYRPPIHPPRNQRFTQRIGALRFGPAVKVHGLRAGVLFDRQGRSQLVKQVLAAGDTLRYIHLLNLGDDYTLSSKRHNSGLFV